MIEITSCQLPLCKQESPFWDVVVKLVAYKWHVYSWAVKINEWIIQYAPPHQETGWIHKFYFEHFYLQRGKAESTILLSWWLPAQYDAERRSAIIDFKFKISEKFGRFMQFLTFSLPLSVKCDFYHFKMHLLSAYSF